MNTFFKTSQFKVHTIFPIFVGVWPIEMNLWCKVRSLISISLILTQTFLQVGTLIAALMENDVDVIIETAPDIILDLVLLIYISFWFINLQKIERIWQEIYCTCQSLLPNERSILEICTQESKKITTFYNCSFVGSYILFMFFQITTIISAPFPQTENDTMQFFFIAKNFLKIHNFYYYHFMLCVTFLSSTAISSAFLAFDNMFGLCVQHACGIFTLLRYHIQNLIPDTVTNMQLCSYKNQDEMYRGAVECIKAHRMIIKFVHLIESVFTYGYLLTSIFMTFSLSFTAYCAYGYRNSSDVMLRYLFLSLIQMTDLFWKFWHCQCIIDHNEMLRNSIYDTNWYKFPSKIKTIMYIMLIRTDRGSYLTGAKFFQMSFKTFTKFLSASASFFTVLTSIK